MGKEPVAINIEETISDGEYDGAKQWLADTGFYVYNHEGHNAMANLIARMEFMATSLGVKVIVLDHITAAATAMMADEDANNERILIDGLMKSIRSLCVRTGVHVDVISQLRKSDKAYEGSRIRCRIFVAQARCLPYPTPSLVWNGTDNLETNERPTPPWCVSSRTA